MGYFTIVIRDARLRSGLSDMQSGAQHSPSPHLKVASGDQFANANFSQMHADSGVRNLSPNSIPETTIAMSDFQDNQSASSEYAEGGRFPPRADADLSDVHGDDPRIVSELLHADENVVRDEGLNHPDFDIFTDTEGLENGELLSDSPKTNKGMSAPSTPDDEHPVDPANVLSDESNSGALQFELSEKSYADTAAEKGFQLHAPVRKKTQDDDVFSNDAKSIEQRNTAIEMLSATGEKIPVGEVHDRALDDAAARQISNRDMQGTRQLTHQDDNMLHSPDDYRQGADRVGLLSAKTALLDSEVRASEAYRGEKREKNARSSDVAKKRSAAVRGLQGDDLAIQKLTIGKSLVAQARPASESVHGDSSIHSGVSDEKQADDSVDTLSMRAREAAPSGKDMASKIGKSPAVQTPPTGKVIRGESRIHSISSDEKQEVNPSRALPTGIRGARSGGKNIAAKSRVADTAQREPEVRIGQVDVFIDAPKANAENKSRDSIPFSPGPRHYLRNI